jgi:FADH2 O2-dependent halogenase
VLLERGTHPRFAIGESTTPLANLSLERLGARYGLADCYHMATYGRWMEHLPHLRRGLKRGFTYYRHHPHTPFADRGLDSERLLVAASPEDALADTHWLRADVDQHLVQMAVAAGVDYRDRTDVTSVEIAAGSARLSATRDGEPFEIHARFVIDATGPGGLLARQLALPSALERTVTRAGIVFGHFDGARLVQELMPALPEGPYPDDWAAVHHLIDEGWMYSLRFDDGITSAGFMLTPRGSAALRASYADPAAMWSELLARYPTIGRAFADATPTTRVAAQPLVQHRLARGVGEGWAMLPHAYAFVDPLFSTGIAWGLRAVERLALAFEDAARGARVPDVRTLARYDAALAAEADQIDLVVAGAYEAIAHYDLFAAQAMLYFTTVSYAEVMQRLVPRDGAAWQGFLGVGDEVLGGLPRESHRRLAAITRGIGNEGSVEQRRAFVDWITRELAPRNVAGLADPARHDLYPVDLDVLVDRHALLGMSRAEVLDALPALRGMSPEPSWLAGAAAKP